MKPLSQKQILSYSILLAVFLLLLIPSVRFLTDKPILPGAAPYYHLRMAEYIKENGIPNQDALISRPYLLQPYHLMMALTGNFTNIYLSSIVIPIICGLASLLLFYFILKQLKINSFDISAILFVLILSPLFIFLFSISNQYSPIIFLILLGFYLFIKDKYYFIPAFALFAIMPFFGILPSTISAALLLVYSINNKHKLKQFYTILSAMIILILAYQLPFIFYYGIPQKTEFIQSNILTNLISDLGSDIGFGIFNILLSFVGLYSVWKIKKQITAYILLLILLLFSFYIPQINIYLTFILAIFVGIGFSSIINMKWKIDMIRILTIILIICGLLFSTLSYANRMLNELPDKETIQSLEWLEENSATTNVVFSHYTKGDWIETISKRQVILDSQTDYIQNLDAKFNDSNAIFYSRNLKNTKSILGNYSIKYIWIDPSMKQGQVWTKEEQGLLFLLRNNETFRNVYSKDGIEIWEILMSS